MKICTKCGLDKEDFHFQFYKEKPVGQCRQCKTDAMKAHRVKQGITVRKKSQIVDDQKLCMKCNVFHPLNNFSPSIRGLGGKSSYCKPCTRSLPKPNKQTKREATQRYRIRNRARWRSLHRLTQFKRRSLITVTCDGTVTDEFLFELYSKNICYYCETETPKEKRTADHVIPLNKGGKHSASNLVMACFSCNSRKRDRSAEEFIQLIRELK